MVTPEERERRKRRHKERFASDHLYREAFRARKRKEQKLQRERDPAYQNKRNARQRERYKNPVVREKRLQLCKEWREIKKRDPAWVMEKRQRNNASWQKHKDQHRLRCRLYRKHHRELRENNPEAAEAHKAALKILLSKRRAKYANDPIYRERILSAQKAQRAKSPETAIKYRLRYRAAYHIVKGLNLLPHGEER